MINIAAVASMTRLHCAFATRSSCWASAWASWHFGIFWRCPKTSKSGEYWNGEHCDGMSLQRNFDDLDSVDWHCKISTRRTGLAVQSFRWRHSSGIHQPLSREARPGTPQQVDIKFEGLEDGMIKGQFGWWEMWNEMKSKMRNERRRLTVLYNLYTLQHLTASWPWSCGSGGSTDTQTALPGPWQGGKIASGGTRRTFAEAGDTT